MINLAGKAESVGAIVEPPIRVTPQHEMRIGDDVHITVNGTMNAGLGTAVLWPPAYNMLSLASHGTLQLPERWNGPLGIPDNFFDHVTGSYQWTSGSTDFVKIDSGGWHPVSYANGITIVGDGYGIRDFNVIEIDKYHIPQWTIGKDNLFIVDSGGSASGHFVSAIPVADSEFGYNGVGNRTELTESIDRSALGPLCLLAIIFVYSFGARWLVRNHNRLSILRFAERVRQALAYEFKESEKPTVSQEKAACSPQSTTHLYTD